MTGLLEVTVTCINKPRRGFGLDIGFINHINTQIIIKSNYNAIDNFQDS
jgi:hypothetical protein